MRVVREAGPYLGIGTSLAATVLLGVIVGRWLDARWGPAPLWTLLGSCLGVVAAMVGFFRTVTTRKR